MRTLEQAPCDALEAAIDSLASEDLTQLDPAEAGCLLQQMVRMRARFDSELSRRVGDFDQREGYRADGSLDTASWLRINCRLSPGAAADHVRVARASRANVELRTALARGDISHHHAAVIARAGQDVGAEAAREISPKLLSLAPHLDPSALRVVAKQEQARVQPESLLQASNREHQRGYLHLSPLDNGMVSINGLADHERASLLDKAAAPYMRPLDAIDDRTVSQRRLDAWVEVARYRLEGGAGASGRSVIGGQRPHLSLIVEERALRQNAAGGLAELDGVPVPRETARRIACDAERTRYCVDPSGDVLDAGRARYTVSASLRRAIALRDRTCCFPGCGRPVEWCDNHHYIHWADGGPTVKWNIGIFCRPHHRLIHEGGWKAEKLADGAVVVASPEGLVLRQTPDGRVVKSWSDGIVSGDDDTRDAAARGQRTTNQVPGTARLQRPPPG